MLLAALVSYAPAADQRRVTGRETEATAIALADFESKKGSKIDGRPVYGDLRHYSLLLERHGNRLHIVFMREDVPLKTIEAAIGVSTKYAWAVVITSHYRRSRLPICPMNGDESSNESKKPTAALRTRERCVLKTAPVV